MANNAYNASSGCHECARNKLVDHRRQLVPLFPASGALESFALNIVTPVSKTLNGNQIKLVMRNRYLKVTKAVTTSEKTASHITSLSICKSILLHGAPTHVLTDNEMQFVCKFLETPCAFLGTIHPTTLAYHLQTNGPANDLGERWWPGRGPMWPSFSRSGIFLAAADLCLYHLRARSTNLTSFQLGASGTFPR